MKIHPNSTLTISNRREIRRLHQTGNYTISELAEKFKISRETAKKWGLRTSPFDKKTQHRKKRVATEDYENAVIELKRLNPTFGVIRLASALKTEFEFANRGTVSNILKAHKITTDSGK